MEYLFFDTECANCFSGTGKICEFGFVLTDENFSVIEKKNILINPDSPFDKKGFAISKIKLAYPYPEYYKAKKFPAFYEEIKGLLTAKNRLVIGHGVKSDVKFISDACKRYSLSSFDYEFVDTERLVAKILDRQKRLKLGEIYCDLYPEREPIRCHEALSDAIMTMEIAKALAGKEGKTFGAVVTDNPEGCGEQFLGRVVDKLAPFRYTEGEKMSGRNREIFHEAIEENRTKVRKGKTFTLPGEYEKTHFPQMLKIVDFLSKNGYRYSTSSHRGKYVSMSEGEARRQNFRRSAVITFQEFLSEIGLSESELLLENIDITAIMSQFASNRDWYEKYKNKHGL